MLKSPRTFFEQYKTGAVRTDPTPAMKLGQLIHTAILEPKKFREDFVIQPDFGPMQSKTNREKRDAWRREVDGKLIVEPQQLEQIVGIVERVMEHERAREMLTGGKSEGWAYAWNERFDRYLLGRPDFVTNDGITVEVKTTSKGVDLNSFRREAFNHDYHGQLALNCMVVGEIFGMKPNRRGAWIVISSVEPYDVAVYTASENVIMAGEAKVERALTDIQRHLDKDPELRDKRLWLGPQGNNAEELEFLPWMLSNDDDFDFLTNQNLP